MFHNVEVVKKQSTICHVLALPHPARGHINPMMCLCNTLTSKKPDLLITFIVTEEWLSVIGAEPKPRNVHFATIPNVLMSSQARASGSTDTPTFLEQVMTKMGDPVERVIDRLEPPVTTIVADTFLVWAVEIGNKRNIPVASFWTMSASVYSVLHHFDLFVQNHHFPVNVKEQGNDVVDYIPGISPTRMRDLPAWLYGEGQKLLDVTLKAISNVSRAQYLLLTSVYELEAQVIDILKGKTSPPMYQIGPTIPYFKFGDNSSLNPDDIAYVQWLDMQPKASVLYVSQGSLYSASKTQLEEIAAGLRISGVSYFWVARKEACLFKEGCSDKGLIVPWCDQLRVLCHSSIGGFLSHCGWNSTLEAVYAGVPMLTFPIDWDQMPNSKAIVEDWKIGWRLRSDHKMGEEENLVTRDEIANFVRRFMDLESDEGKNMRRRVRDLREICHQAVQKAGSSDICLDAFVNDISCVHNN